MPPGSTTICAELLAAMKEPRQQGRCRLTQSALEEVQPAGSSLQPLDHRHAVNTQRRRCVACGGESVPATLQRHM